MATLSTTHPTLLDVAKREDPDGKIAKIVEILSETNEILPDAVFMEGNMTSGHRTSIRAGLPTPTWRKLNEGVNPAKSETVQVTDNIGNMEAYSEVDKDLADLNHNTASFRMSEDSAHIEGMNQEMADTLFYGNESLNPEEFTGFAPRFPDLAVSANSDNVLNGGGAGSDNTSVWLVSWGPQTVHMVYPKGSKAGLQHTDLGEDTKVNADGSMYQIYRAHYKWQAGLVVRDWRYVVRIANIDNSLLTADKTTGADLTDLMSQAIELLPHSMQGRPAFYCNRTVKSYLRRQRANTTNVNLTMDEVGGRKITMFDGIPVRRCDALHVAESALA